MPSRHDYAREAAGRARLRFNHRHPSLSAKESHVVSFAPAEKEPDNEVKSVDPGEHHPLRGLVHLLRQRNLSGWAPAKII